MLLAVLVIAAYAHTFGAGFLLWDDPEHITQNLRVTAPDGVARIWSDTSAPGFLPLTYLTWFVEWRLGAGPPTLFRLHHLLPPPPPVPPAPPVPPPLPLPIP